MHSKCTNNKKSGKPQAKVSSKLQIIFYLSQKKLLSMFKGRNEIKSSLRKKCTLFLNIFLMVYILRVDDRNYLKPTIINFDMMVQHPTNF